MCAPVSIFFHIMCAPVSVLFHIMYSCQVLINTFPGDNLGFGGRVGEEDQFMESLKRSIEYCRALDCHLLHIMAGRWWHANYCRKHLFMPSALNIFKVIIHKVGCTCRKVNDMKSGKWRE